MPQWPRLITQALERAAHGAPDQASLRALAEAVERQRRQVRVLAFAMAALATALLAWVVWVWRH